MIGKVKKEEGRQKEEVKKEKERIKPISLKPSRNRK